MFASAGKTVQRVGEKLAGQAGEDNRSGPRRRQLSAAAAHAKPFLLLNPATQVHAGML